MLVVVAAAVVGHALLDGQPEPDYRAALVAVYTVAASAEPARSRVWCALAALVASRGTRPTGRSSGLAGGGPGGLVWDIGLERHRSLREREQAALAVEDPDPRVSLLVLPRPAH